MSTSHRFPFRFAAAAMTATIAAAILTACATTSTTTIPQGTSLNLTLLETTDLHSNVLSYDYYKLADDRSFGFERTAALIREARAEATNSMLFDDGDTIQGTALSDWESAQAGHACKDGIAIYRAMDKVGFDAGGIGNHEFNYGLNYLSQATNTDFRMAGVARPQGCVGTRFPLVLANVFNSADGKPLFTPWTMLTRTFRVTTPDGKTLDVPLKIGVIGFAPIQILTWDRRHLEGKVNVITPMEAAARYIPEMRAQGADLIVALNHAGISTAPVSPGLDNTSWHLSKVPGIDVLMTGHSHSVFPDPGNARSVYNNMTGVDNQRGLINGVPAVMAGFWGNRLGIIKLVLVRDGGAWKIVPERSQSEARPIKRADGSFVEPQADIGAAIHDEHLATIQYVRTPIGTSDFRMSTQFALIGDVTALEPVNLAQADYVRRALADAKSPWAGLPVLSLHAPFKTGFGGATDFTDVAAGPLAIDNAADLYLYPNTVQAMKVTGTDLQAWLEKACEVFNRIDPEKKEPQDLINTRYPSYNFDVLQGDIRYRIDVTRPQGKRVVDFTWRGQPVGPTQEFVVATNNYRASGGGLPITPAYDGRKTILEAPDTNRDTLIEYIRTQKQLTLARHGDDRSWSFVPVRTAGPVIFRSAANQLDLARAHGMTNVSRFADNGDGTWMYSIDLSASALSPKPVKEPR